MEKMVDRLKEDHRRARNLAWGLQAIPLVTVEDPHPPSNMVYFQLKDEARLDGLGLQQALARSQVKISPVSERRVRLVVHYWIDDEGVTRTIDGVRLALAA